MLFNSLDFGIFLPIVFFLYWFVFNKNIGHQNFLIVFASYIFYGWWDWRFLFLIFFSTCVDFIIGVQLGKEKVVFKRKILLGISLIVNLGLLAYFKYFNFFIDNFKTAFSFFGEDLYFTTLNIILPVGISFYTFQTLSYSIDVYNNKISPTHDFISFTAFVSFFPQLVAGPIERAKNLLPQFFTHREFKYSQASEGSRQILWGLFKKVVIADNCEPIVNQVFNNYASANSIELIIGAIFFAFQIYGDFSGYSDIAIGTAKLFGFDLMTNFRTPYFSRDMAEFWRRWHISLSTWFRDYLYIPLGGSKGSAFTKIRNTFVIFIVSGFWHGANWTFIVWGVLNAIYFLPLQLTKRNRKNLNSVAQGRILPKLNDCIQIVLTFSFTCIAWVFFRSETLTDAILYLQRIFIFKTLSFDFLFQQAKIFVLLWIFIIFEWQMRDTDDVLNFKSKWVRRFSYGIITLLIIFYGVYIKPNSFIYFQF